MHVLVGGRATILHMHKLLFSALILSLLLNVGLAAALFNSAEEPEVPETPAPLPVAGSPYPVLRVIDGDTIAVGIDGTSESVRLIGIDTPELNDPGGPQCYAEEALRHLTELTQSGTVLLVPDESQGARDRHGRLLAYITRPDGADLGEAMLRDGYALEYQYAAPYARQAAYEAAQTEAMQARRGLWADEACK